MDILDRILLLLQEREIEQQDLAAAIGVKKGTISEWKKGKTKSYMKYINKIADYFDVSVDYLLGKTNISTQDQKDEFSRLTAQMSTEEQQKVKEYMKFLISQRKDEG